MMMPSTGKFIFSLNAWTWTIKGKEGWPQKYVNYHLILNLEHHNIITDKSQGKVGAAGVMMLSPS